MDYAALAKQNGGFSDLPKDYAALAQKNGGFADAPKLTPAQFAKAHPVINAVADFGEGLFAEPKAIATAASIVADAAKNTWQQQFQPTGAGNKVTDIPAIGNFVNEAGRNDASTSRNPILRTVENAAGATASALGTVFSPVSNLVQSTINAGVNSDVGRSVVNSPVGAAASYVTNKANQLTAAHPQLTRNVTNAGNIALTAAGGGEGSIEKPIGTLSDIKNGAGDVAKAGGQAVDYAKEALQERYKGQIASDWEKPTTVAKPAYNGAKEILKASEQRGITPPPQHLAELGISPQSLIETDGTRMSRYATTDMASKLRADATKMSSDAVRPALEAAQPGVAKVPLQTVEDRAVQSVINDRTITDKQPVIASIRRQFQAKGEGSLAALSPDGFSLTDLHDNKINFANQKGVNWADPTATNANKNISQAFRQTLEQNVPSDIPIRELNQQLQKFYNTADYLDSLNNKTVPASKIGNFKKASIKAAGAAIGAHMGGLPAEYFGYMMGGTLDNFIAGASSPLKSFIIKNLEVSDPAAYTKMMGYPAQAAAANAARPQLGPGTPLGEPGNPIIPPAPNSTTYEPRATNVNTAQPPAQRLLPAGDVNGAQGATIALPESAREYNLGTNETRNLRYKKPVSNRSQMVSRSLPAGSGETRPPLRRLP